jgi:membrane-bound lytic murein transglycosylase B
VGRGEPGRRRVVSRLPARAAAALTRWLVAAVVLASAPPPAPDAPLPDQPKRLAQALTRTRLDLRAEIRAWPAPRRKPPRRVTLDALYQQRIERKLAVLPLLARATISRLPPPLARGVRDEVTAQRKLQRLARPIPLAAIRVGRPLPADVLLRYYREAERRFHVRWQVLAAVNFVESAFNKLRNRSSAGAQGPMQFLPSTWRAYGLGGDVHDPHDAILGAANYLHASGAPRSYRRALFAYNRSALYVDAVLRYAGQIARDRRSYYDYYSRQVFVRTPAGVRRVTGP